MVNYLLGVYILAIRNWVISQSITGMKWLISLVHILMANFKSHCTLDSCGVPVVHPHDKHVVIILVV